MSGEHLLRTEPPFATDERATMLAYLEWQRTTMLRKAFRLSEDQLRFSPVTSGNNLLGMIKHLTHAERWWFRYVFAAEDVTFPWTDDDPDADWRVEPGETSEQIVSLYRDELDACRLAIGDAALDDRARRDEEIRPGVRGPDISLRWLVAHMIEETARHAGHADIIRELIDGETGE